MSAEKFSRKHGGATNLRRKGASHVIAAPEVSIAEPAMTTNLLNLLIVEDERSVRECCHEVARSLGFNVHTAESRDEAITHWTRASLTLCCSTCACPDAAALTCFAI